MDVDSLIASYHKVYHMAEVANWEGIRERGLLSTSALLDLYGYSGERRERLESRHRPELETIKAPGLPPAVLRDQKVLEPKDLAPLLVGVTVEEWYRLLNSKVFFWASWFRLEFLLGALSYRGKPHVVISVDMKSLVDSCATRITLTDMNTGSARRRRNGPAPKRGRETFRTIEAFPIADEVMEVAVESQVPDILSVSLKAEIWKKERDSTPQLLSTLWTKR